MKKTLLNSFFILLTVSAWAQFEITGELRPRFEYRDGYKTMRTENSADAATFITQRTRIGMNFSKSIYKTHISFQDVRIWGEEQIKKNHLNIGLHEAWFEVEPIKGFRIKTGRQGIQYDNGRLLTKANWNQVGLKHDAVQLAYHKKGFEAELSIAYNQSHSGNFEQPYTLYDKQYQSLSILWLKKKFNNIGLASLSIVEGLQKSETETKTHNRITTGLIGDVKISDFDVQLRGFYQTGHNQKGKKLSAFYLNGDFNYKLNSRYKFTVGMEFLSGNKFSSTETDTDHSFDILYGARHKFNGMMDYFSTPSTTKGFGLVNPYFKVNTKINKLISIGAEYHHFLTANEVVIGDINHKQNLGSEIDLVAKIKITKELNLMTAYGCILPTKTMEVLKEKSSAKPGHYFMTMLTFKPVFFKSEK